ncbi:response regulator [uncultured Methylobacterium sp.]|uniref:response regulator n=1 Tax=uncultured Methylobacterium sp. TaxID=157278 RepID=UPI0035CBC123
MKGFFYSWRIQLQYFYRRLLRGLWRWKATTSCLIFHPRRAKKKQMNTTIILLLVDDDELIRRILEEALGEGGYKVIAAKNGNEAHSVIERKAAELRGLVTDINLGHGPDGWDVARRAREIVPELPVVYMSGASGHEWASHGVPNSTLVKKPFAPAQILTAISALMNISDSHP